MQNDKIYSELSSFIETEEEKDHLVEALEEISQSIYKMDGSKLRAEIESKIDSRIAGILEGVPQDELKKVLNDLKLKVSSMPIAHITLSFNPTAGFVKKLHAWILENLKEAVVSVVVDPEIIGGLNLELGGKYLDLTLKKKLNELTFQIK